MHHISWASHSIFSKRFFINIVPYIYISYTRKLEAYILYEILLVAVVMEAVAVVVSISLEVAATGDSIVPTPSEM